VVKEVEGTMSRYGYFLRSKYYNQYFLCMQRWFQGLSKAFRYPVNDKLLIGFFKMLSEILHPNLLIDMTGPQAGSCMYFKGQHCRFRVTEEGY